MNLGLTKVAVAFAVTNFLALPASATTRTVSPGSNDTSTVQNAINASSPGRPCPVRSRDLQSF